ncbi:hypothetical protein D9Q98_009193 [Chlorella vulgaris]|uniref:Uncharacterized protein n=1 Tax=Chlorella vulgaris TaxID=3077 RepID=A0A9D4YWT3_CHLVU|nr:hypothetical protein D9Q98_009193 [Chlorella vulgaris]
MSMWHVALLEHLERHEEMLRRVSLEHVERQEEMLRRVLTEIAAGQQELATEQRAEAYPEKPDLLLTAFWPAVLELVKTATLPQPGVSKRDAEE